MDSLSDGDEGAFFEEVVIEGVKGRKEFWRSLEDELGEAGLNEGILERKGREDRWRKYARMVQTVEGDGDGAGFYLAFGELFDEWVNFSCDSGKI